MLDGLTDAFKALGRGLRDKLDDSSTQLQLKDYGPGLSFGTVDAGTLSELHKFPLYFANLFGGMPAESGEVVTLQTALGHSVVWACNRLISETAGSTPLVMLQEKGGAKELASSHPMYSALRYAPNAEMSSMAFRETRTSHRLLEGNGYAFIERRSGVGTAMALHPLDPGQVHVDREKGGQRRLVYVVDDGTPNGRSYTVEQGKPQDILHIRGIGWDGLKGYSVIHHARQSIGTALAVERHVARFYAGGGRVPYNIKLAKKFKTDAEFDKFRRDWEATYSQPHKVPMLEPDIEYQQVGMSAIDAQMAESRLFDIHEICRWFLVSPHLVGDLSRATFSNIEQLALEFVKVTMNPHYTGWEQDLWRCVLTPEEKNQGYYFKHNTNELLRGDFLTRMQGYSIMLQNGVASQNEVRDLEDWNPYKGGDGYHIQLNMQNVDPSKNPVKPESPSLVRLSE